MLSRKGALGAVAATFAAILLALTGSTPSAMAFAPHSASFLPIGGSVSQSGGGGGAAQLNVALTLTPSQTNATGPWTFGQPIKDGDVPAGNYIHCSNTSACQADIRNYWPDGSAKFAVLSGVSNFTNGTPLTIALTANSGPPTCTPIAEPANTAYPDAYVAFTSTSGTYSIASSGTFNLDSVIGQTASFSSASQTGGLVRSIPGCVMSEFDYFQPIDGQLHIMWYVRVYSSGATEIEAQVENGWFNKAGPTQEDYGVSVCLHSGCGAGSYDYSTPYISWGFQGEPMYAQTYSVNVSTGVVAAQGTNVLDGLEDAGSLSPLLYSATATYSSGSQVSYNGNIYQSAVNGNLGNTPSGTTSNTADWTYISPVGVQFYVCTSGTSCSPGTIYTIASASGGSITVMSGETLPSTVTAVYIIGHMSHTRWGYVGWYSGGAPVVPAHDTAYFQSTKLVPNYGAWDPVHNAKIVLTPDANAWGTQTIVAAAGSAQIVSTINPPPFYPGDIDLNPSAGGYHQDIGVLPRWESEYVVSAAPQAFTATMGNMRAEGKWEFYFRDETTGHPIDPRNYTTYSLEDNWGAPYHTAPTAAGAVMQRTNIPHLSSMGYLPYLISGRISALEELQFLAADVVMQSSPAKRGANGDIIFANDGSTTTRGMGWAIRVESQAASADPRYFGGVAVTGGDADLASAHTQSIHDTAAWIDGTFVPPSLGGTATGAWANTVGYMDEYSNGYSSGLYNVSTVAGSTTVTMQSGNVPSGMVIGEPIDGPTATTGIPAGAVLASVGTNTFTFAVQAYDATIPWPAGDYVSYNSNIYQATTAENGTVGNAPSGTTSNTADWNYIEPASSYGALTTGSYSGTGGLPIATSGSYGPASVWQGTQWEVVYQVSALCTGADLGIEGLSNQATLLNDCKFGFNAFVPLFGIGAGAAFPANYACNYDFPYLLDFTTPASAAPIFATVAQKWFLETQIHALPVGFVGTNTAPYYLYQHNQAGLQAGTADSSSSGGQGYWGELIGILGWGIDEGATGATAAFDFSTGAANYEPTAGATTGVTLKNNSNDTPQFSFVPRTLQLSDAWLDKRMRGRSANDASYDLRDAA